VSQVLKDMFKLTLLTKLYFNMACLVDVPEPEVYQALIHRGLTM